MEIDSIPFVSEKNVSTHLGEDKPVEEVLGLMIDRLRASNKTVDTQSKPQILFLTQDTLKVANLWKTLRDRYTLSSVEKVSKKK